MRKVILFCFLLLTPILCFGLGYNEIKKIGSYSVHLSINYDTEIGQVLIKRGKQIVYKEADIGNHYFFGPYKANSDSDEDPYSGKRLTGTGVPILFVTMWSGGAHCCYELSIFELGKKFKKIQTIQTFSSPVEIVDLDKDKIPEIEFSDGVIDYVFASFAFSPGGRTVLKFDGTKYTLAPQLMRKKFPSLKAMKALTKKIEKEFREESPDLPYPFLSLMMDLSYTGHFQKALAAADELWPANKPGLSDFKKKFRESLSGSLYWQEF